MGIFKLYPMSFINIGEWKLNLQMKASYFFACYLDKLLLMFA